jgi:hypothetical protein
MMFIVLAHISQKRYRFIFAVTAAAVRAIHSTVAVFVSLTIGMAVRMSMRCAVFVCMFVVMMVMSMCDQVPVLVFN